MDQIFESGSAATSLAYDARLHEIDWQNFVRGVSSCSSLATSGNTFLCLQAANTSEVTQGLIAAISESPEMFGFIPTIDGSGGVFPDFPSRLFAKGQFAHLPFISGTNLDEGCHEAKFESCLLIDKLQVQRLWTLSSIRKTSSITS